ncbi:Asp-tRNA(Asn)/Glu-tRNA(Gln) amidotransferase subunit GatB [Gloeobacter kilaueensis]|uniref:Aspartyl/glutamyl-tRNA(Asn/Gln) amidotransferase subunit B n=1 Tax=Gloeobacter kilaueensis (strain ATCC BAA-2537 / CCAP 1431/1 / ULC 316 / JS1) TaxID=1183438 RepID=U5QIK3_GLOK1|nr:Asp-tRNA(Asn)/Glu-tRNA(Gln) amidotransferase subunit GatB [Gloeobacter kilaueensis]AGY58718.1 aspartyl/glutamyl-tRNA amidotransferase subunit B [Gloeobacter kilaueensis JS1]
MTSAAPAKVQYEAVIGLEVHVQLSTATKLFCHCSTQFGNVPNTNICPICTGQPGTLPVLNAQALDDAVLAATALNCQIHPQGISKFDRKQYFYPDLPKNYQISQYDLPLAEHGWLEIQLEGQPARRIGITRLHMEEDAGKLVHAGAERLSGSTHSLVDFNRSGVPLCEIVSEPDIRSAAEAAAYAEELRRIVRYLGVSDGNMQEGSMRFDLNISVRPVGQDKFGTKVEVKNLNSFNSLQRAVEFEFVRQVDCLASGERIAQETRLWDEASQRTISMRSKEEANDYRYFPEPDLVPIAFSAEQLENYRARLPELPAQKRQRYQQELGLSAYDARVLTDERESAEYFEKVVALGAPAKQATNFVTGAIAAYLNESRESIAQLKVTPEGLAELLALINQGKISNRIANELLPDLFKAGGSPRALVEERGLVQISDRGQLEQIVDEVLAGEPDSVAAYHGGRTKVFGSFVGKVMKKTAGRANPQVVNELLLSKLAQQPPAPSEEQQTPADAQTEPPTPGEPPQAPTGSGEEPPTPVS